MSDPDRLDDYKRKRDFRDTPEPGGDSPLESRPLKGTVPLSGVDADQLPRFVVQEHHARRLHWDLRLEHEGTLASWAVPRGIPADPARNHLAVRTEDHPLEYLEFHGDIPAGNYGAGSMTIWDRGRFEVHKWRDVEVMVTLHGERVQGKYVLFHTRGKDWMIHRMDPPQDPDFVPMPEDLQPMMAATGKLPARQRDWAFEVKWDGVRALAYVEGGRVRLTSRSGRDITSQYPEVRGLADQLGSRSAVLDGEIVAFGSDGRPSFQQLQKRMHVASERQIARFARDAPVAYVAFDLLWLEGRSWIDRPYEERREQLLALELRGPTWQVPGHHVGDGDALLAASRANHLEGIVAKRLGSPYCPGKRSKDWVKIKNVRRTSVVIGGWLPGEGGRSGRLGALCVGFHEDGELRYAGRVGTGFNEAELDRLGRLLEPLAREKSPFSGRQPPKQARHVEPSLVAEVEFIEWTQTRTLRAPSYKGIRDDVEPADVTWDPGA
jgi:bifunctional non-homologous end joining protein LigD